MAIADIKRSAKEYPLVARPLLNQRGAAVVLALLLSAAVLAVSVGVMEMSGRSTEISGAGKGFQTVSEAADGSIGVVQDALHARMNGDNIPSIIEDDLNGEGECFDQALIRTGIVCNLALTLPGPLNDHFTANVSLEKLYSQVKIGGRIEFPPSNSGSGNNLATYYRISATAEGPKNLRAEKTVLYRFSD